MMVAISISALLLYVGQLSLLQSKVKVRETRRFPVPSNAFSDYLCNPGNLRKWIRGLSEVNAYSINDGKIAFTGHIHWRGKKVYCRGKIDTEPNIIAIEIEDEFSVVRRLLRFQTSISSTQVELELISYKTSAWRNLIHILSTSTVRSAVHHELRYLDLSLAAEMRTQDRRLEKNSAETDS
jgi:hypothetical protein